MADEMKNLVGMPPHEPWIPEDDRPFKKLMYPPKDEKGNEVAGRNAGIHAIEAYTPRHACKAADLEKAHGVDGKYVSGLMMQEFAGPGTDEDPVSFGLTAVSRLMWKYRLKHAEVGMMYVGSESLIDRARSIKENLMMLFEEHGCSNIEGVDVYNACYGGTAALLNCMNWVQSWGWDGRWAISVCTDIADSPPGYRFMVGAAAVAMLVGVDAPMRFIPERQTHIIHRWDFYKPIGWETMAPIVDGPGSIDVYYECLDACQNGILGKTGLYNIVDEHNFLVFHLGSGPKFVKHAFERCIANAFGYKPPKGKRMRMYDGNLSMARTEDLFNKKVCPSLRLAKRVGPMHTVATYMNITSLLIHENQNLIGKFLNIFSYGSGAASTMFRVHFDALPGYKEDMHAYLDSRDYHKPSTFDNIQERYSLTYAKFGWKAVADTKQRGGAFYLTECDVVGRRTYVQVVDPEVKLSGPLLCEPPPRTKGQIELDIIAMKPPPPPAKFPEEIKAEQDAAAATAAAAAKQQEAQMAQMGGGGGDQQAQLAALLQLLAQQQQK